MLGFRNLNNHFYKRLLDLFISKLLTFFQSKQNNLIFIMNFENLNEYFNFKSKANNPLFKLLISIIRNLKYSSNYIFFWKRFYFKNNDGKDLSKILKNIEQNGCNYRSSIIPQKFFKSCINNFTIPFWSHAIEYFNSYKALFNYYKPKIALFGTDNSEVPIISAYAASSLGINTMVMPHGIELWGGENLHDTNDGPFKYYAGIGTFDTDNYYSRGISNQRIINANLPWFSHQRFKTSF